MVIKKKYKEYWNTFKTYFIISNRESLMDKLKDLDEIFEVQKYTFFSRKSRFLILTQDLLKVSKVKI